MTIHKESDILKPYRLRISKYHNYGKGYACYKRVE